MNHPLYSPQLFSTWPY